jgi:hypothetical protein
LACERNTFHGVAELSYHRKLRLTSGIFSVAFTERWMYQELGEDAPNCCAKGLVRGEEPIDVSDCLEVLNLEANRTSRRCCVIE